MRWALVDDKGKVQNVVEWDGDTTVWQPPEGLIAVSATDSGSPGDTWDGEKFIEAAPPEEIIDELTALKRVLLAKNILTEADLEKEKEPKVRGAKA